MIEILKNFHSKVKYLNAQNAWISWNTDKSMKFRDLGYSMIDKIRKCCMKFREFNELELMNFFEIQTISYASLWYSMISYEISWLWVLGITLTGVVLAWVQWMQLHPRFVRKVKLIHIICTQSSKYLKIKFALYNIFKDPLCKISKIALCKFA